MVWSEGVSGPLDLQFDAFNSVIKSTLESPFELTAHLGTPRLEVINALPEARPLCLQPRGRRRHLALGVAEGGVGGLGLLQRGADAVALRFGGGGRGGERRTAVGEARLRSRGVGAPEYTRT